MANSSPMKQPRRFRRNTLWLALMAAPLAHAQPVSLDPIQVTADREVDADTVVDAETIERFQADDLEDVFAGQPDVSVGGSNSIAQKVYVRGFEDPLLNVSVDGATQAGALFHHSGRLSVEPELLKQVEVNAGAGRATDGAGALGGSIRFVTKDPADLLRPGESAGALVKLGSFSNTDGYKASGTAFGRLSDNWSTLVSVSQSDHEPFKDGSGDRIAGSDARQQLGFAKLVGQLPADQTIKLSHEVRTDEGERPQRPQWVVSGFNRLYELDGRRDTTTLNYGYAPAGNALVDLEATVYHTESDIEQNVEDRWGRYFGFSRNIGGDLRNTSRFGEHSLTYGVDYREDKVNAGYQEDKRAEQQTGEVLGVYLQGDLWLTSRLLFSAGARYDDYRLKDNDDQRFSEDEVSPNANLAWEVVDGLTLKAGYAEAFRGPTTQDSFKLEGSENDPDLEGEKARNTEVGFDYRYETFRLSAEVYRSEIKDAIADPLLPFRESIYKNIGDLESDGYLITAGYQWQALSAGLSFHSNDAEVDGQPLTVYEHNLLGNTMGDTWIADLAYRWDRNLEFGWQGRFVEGIDNLDTSVGTIDKPGYGVHDLFLHWLPTGNEDLRLSLTIKNVGDKQYLAHASNADYQHIEDYEGIVGMPEPGRDIRVGLAMRF
ncbi:MAG: TonB-dependent receptor [Pseudomonadales bacterium]|uniref:TonB-dependent receptor domain-containing protein n=1 Tax=Marinobacter nauticus TaxID=2743 RepID=UPI0002E881A7|nr:TonB-dependent receptor [Marinobacter nauticus]MCG8522215.1 TonB-dependent receptor [Pseudomonadales bacterium]